MVGVVGRNGAGKSTLLRLIGGVGRPDEGSVRAHGRVGALLDLGAGFHPDLTGRENVFINGVVAGLTRREVAARFDAILAFAELEQFIDSPMRTYSTGMQMRLSFAVAIHTDPEVLLIDEVLSVGDLAFQRKCLERVAELKGRGCAILFVSHDGNAVRQLCEEAIWLRAGRLVAHGPAQAVVAEYEMQATTETRRRTPLAKPSLRTPSGIDLRVNENRFGSLELEIADVRLLDTRGHPVTRLAAGDGLRVEVDYLAPRTMEAPIVSVSISRQDQVICFDTSTEAAGVSLPDIQGHGRMALHIERLDLAGGHYYVDVGIYEHTWAYAYDYHWQVYPLDVESPPAGKGLLHAPSRWDIDCVPSTPVDGSVRRLE